MVNKSELFKKIGGILTEINEQYQYISSHPDSLNELELELLSANANFLAEHVSVLKKMCVKKEEQTAETQQKPLVIPASPTPFTHPTHAEEPASPSIAEIVVPTPAPVIPIQEIASEEKPTANSLAEISIPTAVVAVEETHTVVPVAETPKLEEPVIVETPIYQAPVSPAHQAPIVPKYSDSGKIEEVMPKEETKPMTLNEIISAQKAQAALSPSAPRTSTGQHKDLKTMVSLNDKLMFIKELFNGYSLAYSEAIEILNRQDSFNSAKSFLEQNYVQKNHWAEKTAIADKFYEVLERRFS